MTLRHAGPGWGEVDPVTDPWGAATSTAERIALTTEVVGHDIAVVLGSGWKPAADRLGDIVAEVPFADLGGFPDARVAGHGSTVRSIVSEGRRILAFGGRVHGYEGHHPNQVVHAVRSSVVAGCRVVVLTNAAGGLRDGFSVGQPVLISDHINLTGSSPLTGRNDESHGPRFPDLSDTWSGRLRALALEVQPSLEEGVYAGVTGPQYETPAEIRMLQALGADLVGMSTVHEAIAAAHLGAEVLGLSLVTNLAAGLSDEAIAHDDVLMAGALVAERMGDLLVAVAARL